MHIAVMLAAERDGELIADLAAERPRLSKADVVRLGWPGAAENARLRRDVPQMLLVTDASWLVQSQRALIDRGTLMRTSSRSTRHLICFWPWWSNYVGFTGHLIACSAAR